MKRYLVLIIAMIQIGIAIYSLSNVNTVAKQFMELDEELSMVEDLPIDNGLNIKPDDEIYEINGFTPSAEDANNTEDTGDTFLNIDQIINKDIAIDLEGVFTRIVYIMIFLVIIINLITIEYASKNLLSVHKISLVLFSALTILMSLHPLSTLLAIVTLAIELSIHRTEEDRSFGMKPIEKVEFEYDKKDGFKKAIACICIYFGLYFFVPRLLDLIPGFGETIAFGIIYLALILFVFGATIFIYKDEFKAGLDAIKNNPRAYKYLILKRTFITMAIVAVANLVRALVTQNALSSNQSSLSEVSTLFLMPLAVIFAPIVEESVFRGSIKKFIANPYVFILVSGIAFGLLHATSENSALVLIVTTIPYAIMGISFALTYEKTNNIFTNIFMHAINNLIAVMVMFIMFGI